MGETRAGQLSCEALTWETICKRNLKESARVDGSRRRDIGWQLALMNDKLEAYLSD